jgi:hypothetical protein
MKKMEPTFLDVIFFSITAGETRGFVATSKDAYPTKSLI